MRISYCLGVLLSVYLARETSTPPVSVADDQPDAIGGSCSAQSTSAEHTRRRTLVSVGPFEADASTG